MGTPAFSALVMLCMAALLGMRFAMAALVSQLPDAREAEAASAEPGMALPPKPMAGENMPQPGEDGSASGMAMLTEEMCLAYSADLQDTCFHTLARQVAARDPRQALTYCARVKDQELLWECQADTAEATATVDRAVALEICAAVPSVKWRGQCHFGMGLALAETDAFYALSLCEKAEIFRDFCRHDVVGEVVLVDLEPGVQFCAREEGDTLTRKTCWHGIGKYLARRDFAEASAACLRSTPDWIGNCYHGVGWGAAERDPDGTLAKCETVQPYHENCRQGVAHQLKRGDPQRALALCESITDTVIRNRCTTFVKR